MNFANDNILGLLLSNAVIESVKLDELFLRLDEGPVVALDLFQPWLVVQIEVITKILHPGIFGESWPPVHLRPGEICNALGVNGLAEDAELQL